MELKLTLRFACCSCHHSLTAVLSCRGAGLSDPEEEVIAAVNVSCPTCGHVCQLLFDPHQGSVQEVRPIRPNQSMPLPSRN